MGVLEAIREGYATLRKSERKVADIILADPGVLAASVFIKRREEEGHRLNSVKEAVKSTRLDAPTKSLSNQGDKHVK